MRRKTLPHMISAALIAFPAMIYGQAMLVEDPAAIGNLLTQIDLLKNQIDLLTKQYDQIQKEYKSITGIRGFGELLKNESFKDNLPDDWESTYNKIRDNGYNGLTTEAKSIYDKNKVFDKCQHLFSIEEKKICEAQSVKSAQDQAFVIEALKKSEGRMNNIKKLSDQIKNTEDPKGIAELQARIAIEQNAVSNDMSRLQLFKTASEVEERILYQKQSELIAKDAAKRGGIDLEPLTFD